MKTYRAVIVFLLLLPLSSWGIDLTLRSRGNENLGDFFFSDMTTSTSNKVSDITIKVSLSCFKTNLRSVINPLSPASTVKMNIGIGPNSDLVSKQGPGDFAVLFPGWMATIRPTAGAPDSALSRDDVVNLNHKDLRDGGTAYGIQNMIVIRPPSTITSGVTGNSNSRAASTNALRYISFEQDMQAKGRCYGRSEDPIFIPFKTAWFNFLMPIQVLAGGGYNSTKDDEIGKVANPMDNGYGQPRCDGSLIGWSPQASQAAGLFDPGQLAYLMQHYQQYMGHDGPLSGEWRASWSADFRTLNVNATFPGDLTICGGFFSPLMLFFDKDHPGFTARTDFKIHPASIATYWPEPSSKGYFLVLDLNKNGTIDDWTELFGEEPDRENGFKKLADYDSNGDGIIDAKDPVFKRLKLWRDRTGKGHSREEDLFSLSQMGVKSISLKYEYKSQIAISNRARLREKSTFVFEKKGLRKKGEIIDVWLSN